MENIASKVIADTANSEKIFCKFLSANDTGETGGHQSGIDQGGSRAGDQNIVGDEGIFGEDDGDKTPEDISGAVQAKAAQGQHGGIDPQVREHPLIPDMLVVQREMMVHRQDSPFFREWSGRQASKYGRRELMIRAAV